MASLAWQMSVDSLASGVTSGSALLRLELLEALTSWLSWTLPSPAMQVTASGVCQSAKCDHEQPDSVQQSVTGLVPLCRVMDGMCFLRVYGATCKSNGSHSPNR